MAYRGADSITFGAMVVLVSASTWISGEGRASGQKGDWDPGEVRGRGWDGTGLLNGRDVGMLE